MTIHLPAFMPFNVWSVMGSAKAKVQTSLTDWQTSSPANPQREGNMPIKGIKNKPLRAAATRFALKGFLMVCKYMFDKPIRGSRGNVRNCQRKARVPMSMTVASLRNSPTISGAKAKPTAATTERKIVPYLTQKKMPSRTRR